MKMDLNANKYIANKFSRKEIMATKKLLKKGLDDSWKNNIIFENKFSDYMNVKHTLACSNGTTAMEEALWACGVQSGDEVIAPIMTYWASAFPAKILGANLKYADIDSRTLCIDPVDIERKITAKTKAIIAVHLYGHPCNMDAIMCIAKKYNLKVVEDFSHAHGATYKGKTCGTIGDVGIASCMGEKSFYLPEGAVLCTNSKEIFEKASLFGHYRYIGLRENSIIEQGIIKRNEWRQFVGAPVGAIKNRMNPVSIAIGIERLNHFEKDIQILTRAMLFFVKQLEKSGYYEAHHIKDENSSMGGWYSPVIFSKKNATEISKLIKSKGFNCKTGHRYFNLDEHPLNYQDYIRENVNDEIDFYHQSNSAQFLGVDISNEHLLTIPRFTKYSKKVIQRYADIYIQAAREAE